MPDSGQLTQTAAIPFDADLLDRLMENAGIDVLVANSKHNVQYLLGGHRSIFFDYMDATGLSRYLPIVIYPKGGRDKAAYIGHRLEKFQTEVAPFWTSSTETTTNGSLDAMEKAIAYLRRAGIATRNIGVEMPFLPADAAMSLRGAFPEANVKDAVVVLERLRARKRPDELAMLREASERILQSMQAVMTKHAPGATKRELTEALRREEVSRGMNFEYCLITAGTSLNRAPSDVRWGKGDILSLELGRQLPRLHRRPVPHGHPRRARCRAGRDPGRDRDHPARGLQADQGRHGRRQHLRGSRAAAQEVAAQGLHAVPRARHGPGQP